MTLSVASSIREATKGVKSRLISRLCGTTPITTISAIGFSITTNDANTS